MPASLDQEIARIQELFRQTFSNQTTCNLQAGTEIILSVIGLKLLSGEIQNEQDLFKKQRLLKTFDSRKATVIKALHILRPRIANRHNPAFRKTA